MSFTVKNVEKDENEITKMIYEHFSNEFEEGYIVVGEEETFLTKYFANNLETIKNFEIRDDDVVVCTFPKTGSTWTQEMVWLITNNLDYEGAKAPLLGRFSFFEICGTRDFEKLRSVMEYPPSVRNSIEHVKNLASPRYIKTHLPFSLLPDQIKNGTKKPKIIYVIRNPKDVCVSFYHHGKLLRCWRPSLEDFSKAFLADKILYGPFWKHILGFWELRHTPNVLILSYEEMKANISDVIKKVAAFFDKKLSEAQIEKLSNHLSFDSMKHNTAVNMDEIVKQRKEKKLALEEDGAFIRSGVVGKHKEELAPEIIEQFNVWIKKNVAGTSFEQHFNYIG